MTLAREVEEQEFEHACQAHQLPDRGQAAGLRAQLAMHGRQRRKDRRELPGHAARVPAACPEEELIALARIADAAEQVFDAVHDAQATRRDRRFRVTAAPPGCD